MCYVSPVWSTGRFMAVHDGFLCKRFSLHINLSTQAAQVHYVWVRASEAIWLEYTRIISVLSDAK